MTARTKNINSFLTIDATDRIKLLEDFFNSLGAVDQRKVFISAFRKTARPMVNQAVANAPGRTGRLRASIGTIMLKDKIGIIIGAKKTGGVGGRGYHGHLVEEGTKLRRHKSGKSTGSMPATHFFERAYKANAKDMTDNVANEWTKTIESLIIRTNKKTKK